MGSRASACLISEQLYNIQHVPKKIIVCRYGNTKAELNLTLVFDPGAALPGVLC